MAYNAQPRSHQPFSNGAPPLRGRRVTYRLRATNSTPTTFTLSFITSAFSIPCRGLECGTPIIAKCFGLVTTRRRARSAHGHRHARPTSNSMTGSPRARTNGTMAHSPRRPPCTFRSTSPRRPRSHRTVQDTAPRGLVQDVSRIGGSSPRHAASGTHSCSCYCRRSSRGVHPQAVIAHVVVASRLAVSKSRIEVEGGEWRPGRPEGRRDTRRCATKVAAFRTSVQVSSGRKIANHGRFSDKATQRRSLSEEMSAAA
jgi:hypothetical protein